MPQPPESLTIHPAPGSWRQLLHHNTSPTASFLRRELTLPTDRPIIMTGHQAEFWHPGILAKYLATDAAAAAFDAHPAHLVVNQDRADSVPLRYPARTNSHLTLGTATVRKRTFPTTTDLLETLSPQMELLRSAFARHSSSPTLSHQVASTISDLMRPYLSLPATTIFATELSRTTLFQSLIAQMSNDPESCIAAYNTAVARHPSAGIRPLTASDIQDRWELPLWHLPPNRPRTHVYAEDLPNIPPHELAPKALFMTALLRLAACDLFIHGTGGGGGGGGHGGAGSTTNPAAEADSHDGYDLIMEDWLKLWLGTPRESLAPMAIVTTTRYLPLSTDPIPSAADLAHARWLAHHARHNPSFLHDPAAAAAKQHLLDQIALLPRHSRTRSDTFQKLQALLNQTRRAHAAELTTLINNAELAAQRFAEREVLFDRTWPFPLSPPPILSALRDKIRNAFK